MKIATAAQNLSPFKGESQYKNKKLAAVSFPPGYFNRGKRRNKFRTSE